MSGGSFSTRVEVIFDVCYKISIKNAERARRKSGNLNFKKIVDSQLINQWNSLLSSTNSKTELIKLIVVKWKKMLAYFPIN